MTIRTIIRIGHPTLWEVAEPITEFNSEELKELVADLFDTMAAVGGAGLAAPQINVSKRVLIFGYEKRASYPEAEPVPMTVLINPDYEALDNSMVENWEACLSLPTLKGRVRRYNHIRYWGYDVEGKKIERVAKGIHAVTFQHEYDHLEGILYPQRMQDMKQFGFIEEFLKI